MVGGGLVGSFTNYLYHLITARFLGPKGYGALDSLISIIYLLIIPLSTISLVITKYVASFKGQNNQGKIESFFWKITKKLVIMTPLITIILLSFTPLVTSFLKLPSSILYILIALAIISYLFISVEKSFLQGQAKFISYTITNLGDGLFRLLLTLLFLSLGWNILGAVFPYFLGSLLTLIFTSFFIKDLIFGKKDEQIKEKKEIIIFTLPVFLVNIGLTSLITADVILARHFLGAHEAGIYSALSTMGKIVYFATLPVVSVIFPLISEAHAAQKKLLNTILSGISLVLLMLFVIIFIFILFPGFIVNSLFGNNYISMLPFVLLMIISMSIYTISGVILNIYLALKITFPAFLVCFFALVQIISLLFLHHSIINFIYASLFSSSLLLVSLLLYYGYVRKKTIFLNRSHL